MKENEIVTPIMHRECELYHYHQQTLLDNNKVVATETKEGGE